MDGWMEFSSSHIRTYWNIRGKEIFNRQISVSEVFEIEYGLVSQPFPYLTATPGLCLVGFCIPSTIAKRDKFGGIFLRTREEADALIRDLPFRKPVYWVNSDNQRIEIPQDKL